MTAMDDCNPVPPLSQPVPFIHAPTRNTKIGHEHSR